MKHPRSVLPHPEPEPLANAADINSEESLELFATEPAEIAAEQLPANVPDLSSTILYWILSRS